MSKIIIFITNSKEESFKDSSISTTINNYKSYFKSPYGGSWSDQEIFHIDKPNLETLSKSLEVLALYSFSIVIFCGPVVKKNGDYLLKINSEENINSKKLYQNYNKHLLIVDDCSKVTCDNDFKFVEKIKPFKESLYALVLNNWECKNYYNTMNIEKCPNQWITVYSIKTPVSKSMGSYYSAFLLKQARFMIGDCFKRIDFKNNFGHVRFPLIHEETKKLIESHKIVIPELTMIKSDYDIQNSLIFGVLA